MGDRRNWLIGLLALAVVGLGAALLLERRPEWFATGADETERESVRVIDVSLDRESLNHVDVFFDRPLGAEREGESFAEPPARLEPATPGVWSWQGANILRFDPSERFKPATRYTLTLDAEALLSPDQVLVGEASHRFVTDVFQIERVVVVEEPLPDELGHVRLRGTLHFNYPVGPRELAPRIALRDPASTDPLPVLLETGYTTAQIAWRSDAIQKQREERTLELVVAPELGPAYGNVTLEKEFIHPIPLGSSERLDLRSVKARPGEGESTVSLLFSSPVEPEAARGKIRVTPNVDFRMSRQRSQLVLRGSFEPGASYRIVVASGLRAIDESSLSEDATRDVRLPDLPASVDFESTGMFLTASGARTLSVKSVNLPKIELAVERVYRNNVLYLLENESWVVWQESGRRGLRRVYGDRIAEETLSVDGERNRSVVTALHLDEYLEGSEPGLYRVIVGPAGRSYQSRQRWVAVTDLGMVARVGPEDVLVWMSSFADLSPSKGVRVRLLSDQNQVLATGTSDARGIVHWLQLDKVLAKGRPAMILAERGSDWSFLPLSKTRVDPSRFDVGGAATARASYDAYLYGERDLYRPGATLHGVALVRERSLATPPHMPALLRHHDPAGQLRSETRLDLDQGFSEFEHDIPVFERTGRHRLELRIGDQPVGQYAYQVEEFVPDRIEVEIRSDADAPLPGEELAYEVQGTYLFGPPAAELAVDSRVRLEGAPFRPQGFEAFSFANPSRDFAAHEIHQESGTLDALGARRFALTLPRGLEVPESLVAVVTARVQEQGGRGVTARTRVPVHPYARYVGLRRTEDGYVEPGEPASFEFAVVAPDGSAVVASGLTAELFRDRWNTVLRLTAAGTYRYESKRESELLASLPVPGGTPRGSFEFTAPEYGSYRVVVRDPETGASAQVRFYASGWGYSPWALEEPGKLELDLDREDYAPGDVARVQVRAPFAGRLLLGVEGNRVHEVQLHTLEGNTATVEVPVRADYRPNVYLTATLIRSASELEPGAVARAYGAVPLFVDRLSHRIPVTIEAPEEIRPRGPLRVALQASPRARLTLAAVDEGILQLIAQKTPDPFEHFYRKRALGMSAHDSFSLLLPEPLEGTAAPGGGRPAAEAQFVRTEGMRRVKPVALWSGVVQADARGRAEVELEVPEFQGALRLMAVGFSGSDFGASESAVRVRDPLVLLPTFPRFVQSRDRFRVPVTLRNDTGSDAAFDVTLESVGPVKVTGEAEQTLQVPDGSERTLYFALESGEGDEAVELTLIARGNRETARASAELGVPRSDLPAVTYEVSGPVPDARFRPADLGASVREAGRRRSLRISRVPLVALYGKLEALVRYPYGCLEQVTSRVFPLLYLGILARELEPELFDESDPDAVVDAGIRRIVSLQLPSGGFSLWPGQGASADLWSSIYATHFLVEADRAGHAVPAWTLDLALGFVQGETRTWAAMSRGALLRAAYALWVLGRADRPHVASLDFIRENLEGKLDATSRALVAAAYARTGNREAVDALLEKLEDVDQVRRQTGGSFESTLRNRALTLLALLDASPDDPRIPDLADRVARDARVGRSWTTQETSFALLALGQLFARQASKPPYSGRVLVAGQEVARFGSETLVLRELPDGPLELELDPGYESGAAWFSFWVRGTPTDTAFAPESHGLEVRRALLRRDGATVSGAVEQGELITAEFEVRSTAGRVQNLVLQNLLPPGLEVENPRLRTEATRDRRDVAPGYVDVRDDRLLVFLDLGDSKWHRYRAQLRAVTPGEFRLPPVQLEAMYDPDLRATGDRSELRVEVP